MAIQASHIFRDSKLGVGLENSMGPKESHYWGSLKIPLIDRIPTNLAPGTPNNSNHITISYVKTLNHLIETTIQIENDDQVPGVCLYSKFLVNGERNYQPQLMTAGFLRNRR